MTSVSAGHIILTPTQPVGSGRPERESNPGPTHQESRALPTELPPPPPPPHPPSMAKAIIVHDAGNKRPWDLHKHNSPSRRAKHLVVMMLSFFLNLHNNEKSKQRHGRNDSQNH